MEQAVHQRQAMGAGYQFYACEGFGTLELRIIVAQYFQVVSVILDVAVSIRKPAVPAAGS